MGGEGRLWSNGILMVEAKEKASMDERWISSLMFRDWRDGHYIAHYPRVEAEFDLKGHLVNTLHEW